VPPQEQPHIPPFVPARSFASRAAFQWAGWLFTALGGLLFLYTCGETVAGEPGGPQDVLMALMLFTLGSVVRKAGRRKNVVSASEAIARDPRQPVLFLHGFAEDDVGVDKKPFNYHSISVTGVEEPILTPYWGIGPVIGLGDPGRSKELIGFAPLDCPTEIWMDVVSDLIEGARTLVMLPSSSPGLD
jgi:hypothetical protein